MNTVKDNLGKAMTKGDTFLVNIDDTSTTYDEIFDPDIREFYNANYLPS